jgi:hypothetical protein
MNDSVLVDSKEEEKAQRLPFKPALWPVIFFEDCMIKLGLDWTERP